jgi:hypothetical protein
LADITAFYSPVPLQWHQVSPSDSPSIVLEPWSAEDAPNWLGVIATRLSELEQLADGWDGHGAIAPTGDVLVASFREFGSVIPSQAPEPSIFPTTVGGVQFEWTVGDVHLELEYLPDGVVDGWAEDSQTQESWHGPMSEIESAVSQWLARLSRFVLVKDLRL